MKNRIIAFLLSSILMIQTSCNKDEEKEISFSLSELNNTEWIIYGKYLTVTDDGTQIPNTTVYFTDTIGISKNGQWFEIAKKRNGVFIKESIFSALRPYLKLQQEVTVNAKDQPATLDIFQKEFIYQGSIGDLVIAGENVKLVNSNLGNKITFKKYSDGNISMVSELADTNKGQFYLSLGIADTSSAKTMAGNRYELQVRRSDRLK